MMASHIASGNTAAIETIPSADTTEVRAIAAPTDKSKPPEIRTSICPSETKTRYTDCRATFIRFCPVRNFEDNAVNTTSAITKKKGKTPTRMKMRLIKGKAPDGVVASLML